MRKILPFSGPEASADLDAVLGQEALACRHLVDAFGHRDGGEHRGAEAFLGKEREPHAFEAGLQSLGVQSVPGVAGLQPFLDDQAQALVQSINHVHRSGVVIEPLGAPVGHEHRKV